MSLQSPAGNPSALCAFRLSGRISRLSACASLLALGTSFAFAQVRGGSFSANPQITSRIDQGSLVPLSGHVLPFLTPDRDLGLVEDSAPVRLYLNLQRTPAQQADLDSLLSEQQNSASPSFHKWLTPEQFGERFGAAQTDIAKITQWLELQGFQVTSVARNASVINFATTAGGVRNTFHAQLHYWNVDGGKYPGTATPPQIPAALAGIIGGIAGLNQLPMHTHHTPFRQERYDAQTHQWYAVESASAASKAQTHYHDALGHYNVTPQDYYKIYNVTPTFTAGNHGEGSTIAIIGFNDFNYGTVAPDGTASGGDAVTFRNLFGITTPLNLKIKHGNANFPCADPGNNTDASGEFALDTEWSGSLAPAANLMLYSCANSITAIQAIVDDNIADVISSSIGTAEANTNAGDRMIEDAAYVQAAAQGQTNLSAQGDSGSDDFDFGAAQGTHGLSIDYPSSNPMVLSIGGTDFQDIYDAEHGGAYPSTYWGASNSSTFEDARGYVPEMTWNESCGSPFIAMTPVYGGAPGESTATYCNTSTNGMSPGIGGGGGLSIYYAQPFWQTGIPGLSPSITKRATPDVSMFASGGGYWKHGTVACNSLDPNGACTSRNNIAVAGGTSFAAPEFAGILALLRTKTGSRQGLVQPALYALARAQYTAGTACYANGQTANNGLTTSLPDSSCIFHDVTTSGNNNECAAGTPNCFTDPGASYGVFTSSGNNSIFVDAYAAGAQYDLATGLGSVDVTNLINKWSTAFSSSTSLSANPASIIPAQSTTLTATVTGGTPPNYQSAVPAVTGTVAFKLGTTSLGSCTLASGTCSISVAGSALQAGSNSITATYTSNGAYPSSTGSTTVTVGTASTTTTATISSNSFAAAAAGIISVNVSCNSACGNLDFKEDGVEWATVKLNAGGNFVASGNYPNTTFGPHTVTITYLGNDNFSASSTTVTFTIVAPGSRKTTTNWSLNGGLSFAAAAPEIISVNVSCHSACGNLHFKEDGVEWATVKLNASGSFVASGNYPNMAIGKHSVTIKYLGNATFAPSAATVNFTILAPGSTASTTTASINHASFPAYSPGIISVHVSCTSACGTLRFTEDGAPWADVKLDSRGNFVASGNYPNRSVGSHTVNITYLGNAQYAASAANPVTFTITEQPSAFTTGILR